MDIRISVQYSLDRGHSWSDTSSKCMFDNKFYAEDHTR